MQNSGVTIWPGITRAAIVARIGVRTKHSVGVSALQDDMPTRDWYNQYRAEYAAGDPSASRSTGRDDDIVKVALPCQ
jgi:hypothetical protein